jgi:hypothetical protein
MANIVQLLSHALSRMDEMHHKLSGLEERERREQREARERADSAAYLTSRETLDRPHGGETRVSGTRRRCLAAVGRDPADATCR